MNFLSFAIFVVLVGGPALWVLFDSAKRYEKPSWILALLTPFTMYMSTAAYVIKRLIRKPVEAPAMKPQTWQIAVVGGLTAVMGLGMANSPSSNNTASSTPGAVASAAPSKPAGPVDHYKAALNAAAGGGFSAALKELYLIPPKSPDYNKAQVKIREYKAKEAAVRRAQEAKQREAARAEAAADATLHPEKYLEIVKATWYKGGFDSVCMANLTIKNTSPITIGDFGVRASLAGESGTSVGGGWLNSKTINKVIKPGQTRTFSDINMGFISDQAESANFEITKARAL